jgi:hypothetical protein
MHSFGMCRTRYLQGGALYRRRNSGFARIRLKEIADDVRIECRPAPLSAFAATGG